MAPSYQQQIIDFCNDKDARAMHRTIREFNEDGYCLADLSKFEFVELMDKLKKAHKRFAKKSNKPRGNK